MRVLFITNSINGSGGLERILSIRTKTLIDKFGYEIHIIVLNEKIIDTFYSFHTKIKFHNINVKSNILSYFFSYRKGIRKVISKIKPDIITVCDDGPKGLLFPVIFGKYTPIIYERHAAKKLNFGNNRGVVNKLKNRIVENLMNIGQKRFDKFIVLTKGNINDWKYKKNIEVIPNPLSFYPKESSKLTNKRVIAVGSHSHNKAYDLLLKIWKKINRKHKDWELHIYGKIDSNKTYIKLAKQLELEISVFFHKPVKNIEKEYLKSSILVLPSRSEGFGMVLIEAMACGLPCIAFDCPHGPADIIESNEDGFLIEHFNISEFANSLSLLINDEEKRMKMGNKAKLNSQRFSSEIIINEWVKLYNNVLNV